MNPEPDTYTSSNGKVWNVNEMPYAYLINARNKADQGGDIETVKKLDAEISRRPAPEE